MIIQVSDILKEPGRFEDFVYTGKMNLNSVHLAGNLFIELKLTNAGSRILVKGSISAPVELECSRCLEPIVEIVRVDVEEEFLPAGSPELDDEILDWDSVSMFPITENRIDLSELVRQNILASYPPKPLCRQDCPGIPYEPDSDDSTKVSLSGVDLDPRMMPLLEIQKNAEGNQGKD